MKLFLATLLVGAASAYAGNKYYNIDMDLSMNGVKIPVQAILAKDKMTETVIDGNRFVEVTANKNPLNDSLKMDFVIGELTKDGERIILSRPTIITNENKPAEMKITGPDGSEELSLSVTPRVKSL